MSSAAAFPDTPHSWIVDRLASSDGAAIRDHLMSVYAGPLQHLARRRLRTDAETAMDLVHGFFASRLARDEYVRRWNERSMRLRRWLWNGLCFYARERRRESRRLREVTELPDVPAPETAVAGDELDRAFAGSMVREALRRAAAACRADGFASHWVVFRRRFEGEESLAAIARDLGLTPDRALVMLRAPSRRFRRALLDVVVADGVPAAEAPRVLAAMRDAIT